MSWQWVMTSLYSIIHAGCRPSREKGRPGIVWKKKNRLAEQIFQVLTSKWSLIPTVSRASVFCHRASEACLVLTDGGERKESRDSKEKEWAMGMVLVGASSDVRLAWHQHMSETPSPPVQGDPVSVGGSVAGSKGEPGQRVRAHWPEPVHQLGSKWNKKMQQLNLS